MATYTTNYNLIKPADADGYDIAHQNGNMDIIDGALNGIDSKIAGHFVDAYAFPTFADLYTTKPYSGMFNGFFGSATDKPDSNTDYYVIQNYRDSNYGSQIAIPLRNDKVYFRRKESGQWSSWQELALNSNLASKPNIITGTFEAKTIAIGTQVITYNVPSNMPNATAKLIVAYSAYDNVYFQWNPQNYNLQNAGCWSFNVRNDRNNAPSATVLFTAFY